MEINRLYPPYYLLLDKQGRNFFIFAKYSFFLKEKVTQLFDVTCNHCQHIQLKVNCQVLLSFTLKLSNIIVFCP